MNLISFLDLVGVSCLLYAGFVLLGSSRKKSQFVYNGLLFLIAIYLANLLPNFIEWMGYGTLVEPFEEYIQILVPAGYFMFLSLACYSEGQREVASRSRVLLALHTITQNLPVEQNAQDLWKELLLRVIKVMGFEGGFVDFQDRPGLVNVRIDWPGSESFAQQVEFLDLEETIVSKVLMEKRPMVVEQAENVPDYFIQALHMSGVHTVALFPVFTEDRVLGVMGIVSRDPHVFTSEEVDLFSMLGHHLGEIILGNFLLNAAKEQSHEYQNALEARRHFLKIVSEDLKEPLERLNSLIQDLSEYASQEDGKEMAHILEQARDDSAKFKKLLVDAKEITLLDPEDLELQISPVSVRRELESVADRFREAARRKNLTLHLDLLAEYAPVEVDRNLFQSALAHLVSNAVQYTPEGGRITISAAEEAEMMLFHFADTGIGIRASEGNKIFDMFYRTERGRGLERTSTGLGLAIVRRIAQLHGGKVSYTSELGKGSVFTLAIPKLQIH